MDAQNIVQVLASQLNGDGMTALGEILKIASSRPVQEADQREFAISKLASDLATAGFEPEEVLGFLDKLAEEQKLAQEVDHIKGDCLAMGSFMGKQAFDTFIGLCADHVKTAQEDEDAPEGLKEEVKDAIEETEDKEDEEEAKDEVKDAKEELSEAKEEAAKEAQVAKLASILSPFLHNFGG